MKKRSIFEGEGSSNTTLAPLSPDADVPSSLAQTPLRCLLFAPIQRLGGTPSGKVLYSSGYRNGLPAPLHIALARRRTSPRRVHHRSPMAGNAIEFLILKKRGAPEHLLAEGKRESQQDAS